MRKQFITVMILLLCMSCTKSNDLKTIMSNHMDGIKGTVVFLDLSSDQAIIVNSGLADTRTAPCSTFKIWNTLIGAENNLIHSANEPFYKWDGKTRAYPAWNRDLNLQDSFTYSCVPAYQDLAKKIGIKNMQTWINKIGYGNKDISSGIDIFWLPRPKKKSILISPKEQTILIKKLVNSQLGFSEKSKHILKTIMLYKTTENGTLYGKTGSGRNVDEIPGNNIGWYAGYVMSDHGRYAFACLMYGQKISGKDSKAMIEKILKESTLI